MCSTSADRIAEIGQAIEDLASQVLASAMPGTDGRGPAAAGEPAGAFDADQVAIRLAELWSQLAELDPEVARRLPTYEA